MMPTGSPDAALDALLRQAVRPAPAAPEGGPEGGPEALDDWLDDGQLARWRAGALEADATAALDARLAADPEARAVAWAQAAWPVDALQVQRALGQLPTVHQRRAPRRPALRRWAGPAALAAAGVLVAAGLWWRAGTPPPPDYLAGTLAGGLQDLRGAATAPAGPVAVSPGAALTLPLRPRTAQEAAPQARAYLSPDAQPGARLQAVEAAAQPAAKGALTVRLRLPGLAPGPQVLWVVLGPTPVGGRPLAEARAVAGLWWHRVDLAVVPEPEEPPPVVEAVVAPLEAAPVEAAPLEPAPLEPAPVEPEAPPVVEVPVPPVVEGVPR